MAPIKLLLNGTNKIITYGTPGGTSVTAKRLNWSTLKASEKGTLETCADAIWDGVADGTTFGTGNTDNWALLDGGSGDCDNLARCMKHALGMLGISGEVELVRASTNAGAGNCLDFETRSYGGVTQYLIMDFATSGDVHRWNQCEGCCNTASKYYAIEPKLKASDDYAMLQAISCRQYWASIITDPYGGWGVTIFDGPIPKP